jgi:glycosyltransferase involved in cell wall biosynthesis
MSSPKRILHVVTIMDLGGIETFLMTLYRRIDRDKFQFDFLVHREKPGYFDDEIRSLGGRIIQVSPLNPLKVVSYINELRQVLNDNAYDIIHSHLNTNTAFVLWIAKTVGIPYRIAHSHITRYTGGMKTLIETTNKLYINAMPTHKMACSDKAGKWLFGEHADYKILNNSIDVQKFTFDKQQRDQIRKDLNIPSQTILIGNIARFFHQKNHEFLIDVFFEFNKNNPSKLLLIGEGELMPKIKRKVHNLGIENDVIFTGAISHANEYLNAMDVFVFPSHYEGLGIVAVEAQNNGLPVVMNSNLPEELDLTPLIYRISLDKSLKAWSQLILKAYQNNKKRSTMHKTVIEKGYDIKTNVLKLEQFYSQLT